MNPIAEQMKQHLSMFEVLERYGFALKRGGVMCCPFHEENTPSFQAYPGTGGWHCFGCGAGGSVIDFVMRLFSLSFSQALIRLDNDFGLGLTGRRPDTRAIRRQAEGRRQQAREREELQERLDGYWRRYALIDRALSRYRPTAYTAPMYARAMAKREYLGHAIDALQADLDRRDGNWNHR